MPPAGNVAHRPNIFSLARKSFRLMAGTILLWSGLVLGWTGASGVQTEQRYREQASVIRGQVVGKSLQPATANTSTRYEVTYRAPRPDAPPVERTEAIDVDAWERLENGSELELQYLDGQPDSIRIARAPAILGNVIPAIIGAVLAPIGAVLVALGGRDLRRRLHLYDHGTPTEAVVEHIEETNVRINRRTQWRVRFVYRDHLGRERRGESGHLSMDEAHEWRPGDSGRVLFDRERPEMVLWVGKPTSESS